MELYVHYVLCLHGAQKELTTGKLSTQTETFLSHYQFCNEAPRSEGVWWS
jgi:hypothetical protein